MVLKYFFNYLSNNPQLIDRMANSFLMRRAAQLTISYMYRAKNLTQHGNFLNMTPENFKSFMEVFKNNMKQKIGAKKP